MPLIIEPEQALLQIDGLIDFGKRIRLLSMGTHECDLLIAMWFKKIHKFFSQSYDSHSYLYKVLGTYSRLKEIEIIEAQKKEEYTPSLLGLTMESILGNLTEEYVRVKMMYDHNQATNVERTEKKKVVDGLNIVKVIGEKYFFEDEKGRIGKRSLRSGPRAFAKAYFKNGADGRLKLEDLNQELEEKTSLVELQASSKTPLRWINRRFKKHNRAYRLMAKAEGTDNIYIYIELSWR